MANGVPLRVRHVGLGLDADLISAEVYDGELVLSGADALFVGQRYLVYAPDTLRSTAASAEVTIVHGQQVLELKVMRPARRIELALTTTSVMGWKVAAGLVSANKYDMGDVALEASKVAAREKVEKFMIDHDVFFNGAAEKPTQESKAGMPQAWSIDNLDLQTSYNNQMTIKGIAEIMNHKDHQDLFCCCYGQTSGAEQAPLPLAEFHRLDRRGDVQEIMDRLAKNRAEACRDALIKEGVDKRRLWTKWQGRTGRVLVDFIPETHGEPDGSTVLPAGVPFRVLHRRAPDEGQPLRDALAQVRAFMTDNDVHFNGAGEELPSTEQAWSIDHLDAAKRVANWVTVEGIANIMNRYPQLCLEIHGETGAAKAAPRRLADYLRLDRVSGVQQIMDRLAESRAQACLGALMRKGVAGSRLFITYKGRGGNIRVDFIPRSVNPYGAMPTGPVPPLGLVHQGHTVSSGTTVVCPLPEGAALYVDEQYVLQMPHLPEVLSLDKHGTVSVGDLCLRSDYIPFTVTSASLPEAVVKATLPLRLIESKGLDLIARYAQAGTIIDPTHWSAQLPLPKMSFAVYAKTTNGTADQRPPGHVDVGAATVRADVALRSRAQYSSTPMANGYFEPMPGGAASALLPPAGFVLGGEYEVRVTKMDAFVEAAQVFVSTAYEQEVVVLVERRSEEVSVRWAWAAGAWYEHLPLPAVVPYTLWHRELNVQIKSGELRAGELRSGSRGGSGSGSGSGRGSTEEQLNEARAKIKEYIRQNGVTFNGASDPALPRAQQAWSIEHMDAAVASKNREVLQAIGRIMTDYPDLGLEVHGVAASKAGQEAPASLAQHYHLRAREDHTTLMEHLARNRADACRRELKAGIDPARLVVTAQATGHEMKTEFIPLAYEALRRKRKDGRAAAGVRRGTTVEVARKKVMAFMEENDVFFNGARERATKESRLGIEQAWSIDNLDAAKRRQNVKTLDGIAHILQNYPEISCEVLGQTTKNSKAEPLLADFDRLDPVRDVQEVMDRLGMRRAEACRRALEARGVDASRFTTASRSVDAYPELKGAKAWPEERVWSKGRAGEMKVDFFPVVRERRESGYEDGDDDDDRRQQGYGQQGGYGQQQQGYGQQPRGKETRAGQSSVGTLGGLLVQQGFELKVAKPDDGRWQPVSAAQLTPCAFSVPNGPSEVTLELVPTGGNVAVTLVSELGGSAHWAAALPLPESMRYEVRHRKRDISVIGARGETLTAPRTVLPADGALLVGEEYTLTVTDASVEQASVNFAVRGGGQWTDVTLRLRPTECASLTLVLDTASRMLPRGIKYRFSSVKRAVADPYEAAHAATAYERVKAFREHNDVFFNGVVDPVPDDVSQAWSVAHSDPTKRAQNDRTLDGIAAILREFPSLGMEVRGTTGKSTLAPANLAAYYRMRPAEDVHALYDHLARNRATACRDAYVARGIDPKRLLVSAEAMTGEMKVDFIPRPIADIDAAAARANVNQSDLHLTTRAKEPEPVRDQTVLEGVTTADGVEVRVGLPQHEAGRFLLGHQYLLEVLDGGLGGVAPHTQAFRLDQPRAEVRARLHLQGDLELLWLGPLEAGAQAVEQRGDGDDLSEEKRLPVLGVIPFTVKLRRTGALTLSASKAEPAAPTAVAGEGRLLQGEEYVLQTEHTMRWAPQAISFVLGTAKDTLSLQMVPATSPPPPPTRSTRDVRVSVLGPDGRAPASALRVSVEQLTHAAAAPAHRQVACEARTDTQGGAVLPGSAAIYVGERYRLDVGGSDATAPAVVEFTAEPGPGVLVLDPVRVGSAKPGWYDDRPAASDAARRAATDANAVHAALQKRPFIDNKAISAAVAGKCPAEVQLLREAYQREHGANLLEALRRHGSRLKGKTTQLEQLLLREHAELDAQMIRFGVDSGVKSAGKSLQPIAELIEVLCTSQSKALVEMREAYRRLYQQDPVDAIRHSLGASLATASAPSSSSASPSSSSAHADAGSVVPLLAQLLEHAPTAFAASTAAAVPADTELLRQALSSTSTSPQVLARTVTLFASRTRRHLRKVVAACDGAQAGEMLVRRSSGTLTTSDVRTQLTHKFHGGLQRAMLLLAEPAEEHYAHKLHAAFYGLRNTPKLNELTLERHPTGRGGFMERVQSQSAFVTHNDTLVAVIAGRFGRDLSGVKYAYEQIYSKRLVDVLGHKTHSDLRAVLVAVVDRCGQFMTGDEYS